MLERTNHTLHTDRAATANAAVWYWYAYYLSTEMEHDAHGVG